MQMHRAFCCLAALLALSILFMQTIHLAQNSPWANEEHRHKPETGRLLQAGQEDAVGETDSSPAVMELHQRQNHHRIICPFLAILINEEALPAKSIYTKEELLQVTIAAGLDPSKAHEHIESNFRNIPEGVIDIFDMEGKSNEHSTSTGAFDCKTSFGDCTPVGQILQCYNETVNKSCGVPNLEHLNRFVQAVDVNGDGVLTTDELVSAEKSFRIPFIDANPIGSGTISGSFALLFDVFGDAESGMNTETLRFVSLQRRFPHSYAFPHLRRFVDVLDPWPVDGDRRVLTSMFADRSGAGNDVLAQALTYDGNSVDLSHKLLQIKHTESLDTGSESFTVAAWIRPESLAYPGSMFLVKKGHGMYFREGRGGWTAGWELGHGFVDDGLRFTGRDTASSTGSGRRCSGILRLKPNLTWSSMLQHWLHVAVVFDREALQARFYLNGELQRTPVSLEACNGSWINTRNLEIGQAYGWRYLGAMKSFQMVRAIASPMQIQALAANSIRRRRQVQ